MTEGRLSEKGDVFSFGILAFELATLKNPYDGLCENEIEAFWKEKQEIEIPLKIPKELGKLIKDCCAHNPKERPTFEDIIDRLKSEIFSNHLRWGVPILKMYAATPAT